MQRSNLLRGTVAAILVAALPACSSSTRSDARSAPEDFALALTILADASDTSAQSPDSPLRSAWYLVEADALLRAAEGDRLLTSPTPPVLRQLMPAEMDELWLAAEPFARTRNLSSESGANDAPRPGDLPGTAILYLHADGKRSASRIDLRAQTPQAQATRQLASRLARWAGLER